MITKIIIILFVLFLIFIVFQMFFPKPIYSSIKTECISIDYDEIRRKELVQHMKDINFNPQLKFFKAITGDDISRREYKDYIDIITEKRIGRLGCWLSHTSIWEKYRNYSEPILVIEDDVRFVSDFREKLETILKYLKNINIDWDLCFLGRNEHDIDINENISLDICDLEIIKNNFYQLHCYIVNCKNIDKLLSLCELKNVKPEEYKDDLAIDIHLPRLMKQDKLLLLGVKNQLAYQISSEKYGSNTG